MIARFGVFALLVAALTTATAQDVAPETKPLTAEEIELVQLVGDMSQAFDKFWTEFQKFTDEKKRDQFWDDQDPAKEFVPKLLAFETRYPGTDAGLMALRRIVLLAASGGSADSPANRGRQDAIKRLQIYSDRPILIEILRYLDSGNFEPATESLLRTLSNKADSHPVTRQYCKFMLAKWMLGIRDASEYYKRRLVELNAGAEVRFSTERKYLEDGLKVLPDSEQLKRWENESVELLQSVVESGTEMRQPAPIAVDPKWYLIRLDTERTKTMPRFSELAAGLLFKELHLRLGKPAPDLQVTLMSGSDWSLAAQRGKAVIIQFSFKGCGPCEAMYPDLQALQREHGERLSILGIMADEMQTTTADSIAEGKLTWNITWDGWRGDLATRWNVDSFPTVYVVSPEGQIAGFGLRGKELKAKVAELLK